LKKEKRNTFEVVDFPLFALLELFFALVILGDLIKGISSVSVSESAISYLSSLSLLSRFWMPLFLRSIGSKELYGGGCAGIMLLAGAILDCALLRDVDGRELTTMNICRSKIAGWMNRLLGNGRRRGMRSMISWSNMSRSDICNRRIVATGHRHRRFSGRIHCSTVIVVRRKQLRYRHHW